VGAIGRWRAAAAITALSAVAHLWRLGQRPLAHDEAIDAFFSWQARSGGIMRYDPVYHGPLRFYLEGAVLGNLGTSAFHARLVAALAGIAATALLAGSTRTLGRVGAPVAALLFTVSPTVLTVTRTGREDSLVALVSIGLLLVVARALTEPRPWHLVAGGALLAASFGLKETTFLFGLNALVFFLLGGAAALRRPGAARDAARRVGALGTQPWVWTLCAFAVTFMVIFTSGFRYAEGLESGLLDGVRYWWSQHDVGRGGQPWFFYLAVYAGYEWLIGGVAAIGVVVVVARRRSLVGAWFVAMAVGQAALYSWAGEKFAWLALHPLLPTVLLAGLGAQAVADRVRAPAARRALATVAAVGVAITAVVAVRPAITDGADPRELLVTVQTSVDVPPIVDRLAAGQRDGTIDSIIVDQSGGGSWPWAWYLHDLENVSYGTLDPEVLPTDFDAMILLALELPPEAPAGYRVERFRLREWWVPDYANAGAGDLLRWFATREVWSPTASADQYLVIREADR